MKKLILLALLLTGCASVSTSVYTGAGRSFDGNHPVVVDYGVSVGGPVTIKKQSFWIYSGYNPVFKSGGIGISKGFTIWKNKKHIKVNEQPFNQRTNELLKFNQINDTIK